MNCSFNPSFQSSSSGDSLGLSGAPICSSSSQMYPQLPQFPIVIDEIDKIGKGRFALPTAPSFGPDERAYPAIAFLPERVEIASEWLPTNCSVDAQGCVVEIKDNGEQVKLNGKYRMIFSDQTWFEAKWKDGCLVGKKIGKFGYRDNRYAITISYNELCKIKKARLEDQPTQGETVQVVSSVAETSAPPAAVAAPSPAATKPNMYTQITDTIQLPEGAVVTETGDLYIINQGKKFIRDDNGFFHGRLENGVRTDGLLLTPNGILYKGPWENNSPKDPTVPYKAQSVVLAIEPLSDGEHTIQFWDGCSFKGTWKGGKNTVNGEYTHSPIGLHPGQKTPMLWSHVIHAKAHYTFKLSEDILPSDFLEKDGKIEIADGRNKGCINGTYNLKYSDGTVYAATWNRGVYSSGGKLSFTINNLTYSAFLTWDQLKQIKADMATPLGTRQYKTFDKIDPKTLKIPPTNSALQIVEPQNYWIGDTGELKQKSTNDYTTLRFDSDLRNPTGHGFFGGRVANGQRKTGIMVYADGTVYVGSFVNNIPRDRGIIDPVYDLYITYNVEGEKELLFQDGTRFKGLWQNGKAVEDHLSLWTPPQETDDEFTILSEGSRPRHVSWKGFIEFRKEMGKPTAKAEASLGEAVEDYKYLIEETLSFERSNFNRPDFCVSRWPRAVALFLQTQLRFNLTPLDVTPAAGVTLSRNAVVLIEPETYRGRYPLYTVPYLHQNGSRTEIAIQTSDSISKYQPVTGGSRTIFVNSYGYNSVTKVNQVWILSPLSRFPGSEVLSEFLSKNSVPTLKTITEHLEKHFYKMTRAQYNSEIKKGDVVLFMDKSGKYGMIKQEGDVASVAESSQPSSSAPSGPITSITDSRIDRKWVVEPESAPKRAEQSWGSTFRGMKDGWSRR